MANVDPQKQTWVKSKFKVSTQRWIENIISNVGNFDQPYICYTMEALMSVKYDLKNKKEYS